MASWVVDTGDGYAACTDANGVRRLSPVLTTYDAAVEWLAAQKRRDAARLVQQRIEAGKRLATRKARA